MIQPLWITESLTRVFPDLFQLYSEIDHLDHEFIHGADGITDYFYESELAFILQWATPQKIHLSTLFLRSVDQMRRKDNLPTVHTHAFFSRKTVSALNFKMENKFLF